MSVQEDAERLISIGESLTSDVIGMISAADDAMRSKMAEVHAIMLGTASESEVLGLFQQNEELRNQVIDHLSMMRQNLTDTAHRLMA